MNYQKCLHSCWNVAEEKVSNYYSDKIYLDNHQHNPELDLLKPLSIGILIAYAKELYCIQSGHYYSVSVKKKMIDHSSVLQTASDLIVY